MLVFVNGEFVPEESAVVSVFDRSFLYGDGLFETIRVCRGRPFRWDQHLERLHRGAVFLKISLPYADSALRGYADQLIAENRMPEALLRLTVSRGVGLRGYSPKGAEKPTVVMSLHPAPLVDPGSPPQWRLRTASFHLPSNEPLAQFKTANKLAQVLARAQAEEGDADEALLLNTDGCVVEGATSNLFWVSEGKICTPPLACGILAGVTREVVAELCARLGLEVCETTIAPKDVARAEGVFLSLSSLGIVEAVALDGLDLRRSPLVERLRTAYADLLARETS